MGSGCHKIKTGNLTDECIYKLVAAMELSRKNVTLETVNFKVKIVIEI